MVNSGAIMSASILLYLLKADMNMAQKYDYVYDFFKVRNASSLFVSNIKREREREQLVSPLTFVGR